MDRSIIDRSADFRIKIVEVALRCCSVLTFSSLIHKSSICGGGWRLTWRDNKLCPVSVPRMNRIFICRSVDHTATVLTLAVDYLFVRSQGPNKGSSLFSHSVAVIVHRSIAPWMDGWIEHN